MAARPLKQQEAELLPDLFQTSRRCTRRPVNQLLILFLAQNVELVIEVVNDWLTSSHFQVHDVFVRNLFDVLALSTEGVTVGCDDNVLVVKQLWSNFVLP